VAITETVASSKMLDFGGRYVRELAPDSNPGHRFPARIVVVISNAVHSREVCMETVGLPRRSFIECLVSVPLGAIAPTLQSPTVMKVGAQTGRANTSATVRRTTEKPRTGCMDRQCGPATEAVRKRCVVRTARILS
jgi:hypothetical protein